jgi:ABC-type lipoprotein export system ATPase subunit
MTFSFRCEGLSAGWPGNVLIENFGHEARLDKTNCVLPIVGRTGRGKSTLLYALSGMARPILGSISWQFPDGSSVTWSNGSFSRINHLRRRSFGFLLQDAKMIDCFTVAENLRHTLRLRGVNDDIQGRILRAVTQMLIEKERPHDFLDKYPTLLSGGMRQRMALAAAIVHDPMVLFADEPTASLDDETGDGILGAIRNWLDRANGKRAFVFVTHRLETLTKHIDARIQWDLDIDTDKKVKAIELAIGPHGTVNTRRAGEG